MAHLIANPADNLYTKLGIAVDEKNRDAIGILTITPSEGAIIAADVANKAAAIEIVFIDRFSGSLVISGDVASVESSLSNIMDILCDGMGFAKTDVTRT